MRAGATGVDNGVSVCGVLRGLPPATVLARARDLEGLPG
jgi:hypothetical protein